MIGRLEGDALRYEAVTSCLVPLGELHGCHVVTVEGINFPRQLSPVQEAIDLEGGSQCGFCTPGIVVSMTWFLLSEKPKRDQEGVKEALSGHLCRCTGYASLKRAGDRLLAQLQPNGAWASLEHAKDRVAALVELGILPAYFAQMSQRLRALDMLPARQPSQEADRNVDFVIAGGTDIYVQKGEALPQSRVSILKHYPQMIGVHEEEARLRVGALTSFEDFADHPSVQALIPQIKAYMFLIASLQLRHRATLGGNIINASPIGDMTCLLLAMDSTLVLQEGEERREIPMRDFFLGYKILARRPKEILAEILIPRHQPETHVRFEKISKRQCLDIASVNSAMKLRKSPQGVIEEIHLSVGGVAPIPLYLRKTQTFLLGKTPTIEILREAQAILQEEIAPISDVRGSAEYKRLLASHLLAAHLLEIYPEAIHEDALFLAKSA
jgi:xanthine dehydrogenase small subunit